MSGTIPPFSQYALMAWCLVKTQGQLYLYLLGPNSLLSTLFYLPSEIRIHCFLGSSLALHTAGKAAERSV
jgi:hypothetical protein